MKRQRSIVGLAVMAAAVMAAAAGSTLDARSTGQRGPVDRPSLAGTWTLNKTLSDFPPEIGFGMDVIPKGGDPRGRGTGDDPNTYAPRKESEFEARNLKQLTDEVRMPSGRIVIEQTDTLVSITDDQGHTRRFHPDGRTEYQPLEAQPVQTIAKWEGSQLVVSYHVEQGRELRYFYTCKLDPPQLAVQVQFVEKRGGGLITRVYHPTRPGEPLPAPVQAPAPPVSPAAAATAAAAAAAPSLRDAVRGMDPSRTPPPGAGAPPAGQQMVPAVPGATDAPIGSMKPDAELRGLKSLGIVVEGLDSGAAACGLTTSAVEAAVTKSLRDGGLKVVQNSDEDTYLYVHIKSATMGPGTCVSRYDTTLFTQTMARMSYGTSPVLVEVSLLRKGGIIGGASAQHGANVVAAIRQYVDGMAARVRDANK